MRKCPGFKTSLLKGFFRSGCALGLVVALSAPAQNLSIPFEEQFQSASLDSAWQRDITGDAKLDPKDGNLSFAAPTHAKAHIQRPAKLDQIVFTGKVTQWASIYLVWDENNWCGVGQVSPTPFGRLYSAAVVNGESAEIDHRGIDFGSARWVRIQLGENYIRFSYSNTGKEWTELRTIERPKKFASAPRLIAAGKYYEAEDKPFASSTKSEEFRKQDGTVSGHVDDLHIESLPASDLKLTEAELVQLRKPKVDPVTATLSQDKEDPTFEKIVGFYPPMKSPREIVGVPAHPLDIGVDRLGRLDVSPWTQPVAWFEIGDPPVPLGKEGVPFTRRLLNGYLPIDTLTTTRENVEYTLTVLGWSEGFSVDKPLYAYIRLTAKSPNGSGLPKQIALVTPANKRKSWPTSTDQNTASLYLKIKYPDPDTATTITPSEFDSTQNEVASFWEKRLAPARQFDVPDTRVMEAYRAWITYSMLNADTINGYIEPHDGAGFYEEMFGNSVALQSMAMDMYGFHDYAAKIIDTQIHFQQTNGLYTQVCGLTDPGGFLVGMARHYRMTGDRAWLKRVSPNIASQCEWLFQQRAKTPTKGVAKGLIKFRPYNDYSGEVYNYLGNVWCAQGLADAADALQALGHPRASRYAAEARQYRKDILASMKAAAFKHRGQTLLPLEPDTHRLLKLEKYNGTGYYGLTASPLLGVGLLSPDDKPAKWIVDILEKRGGLIAGVCEFQTGIDHAYTYGYLLNAMKRGEVRKTLLGFWSMLAFGMTRDTYSPVEVTMIETGDNHYTLPHLYSCTDQLRLLRALLLREDKDVLWIGEGIPRAWLEPGKHVSVNSAATEFGDLSYTIQAQSDGTMNVHIDPPVRRSPAEIKLRLRHPQQLDIASVKTTSKAKVKRSGEMILLRNITAPIDLQVRFKSN